MGRSPKPLTKERLLFKSEIGPSPDHPIEYPDCWNWTGNLIDGKYGQIFSSNIPFYVHRVSAWLYELKDPEGNLFTLDSKYGVCHHCDNTRCTNYRHLFIGTCQDNANDMINKGRKIISPGIKNGMCKITEEIVKEIRKLYEEGDLSQIDIGNRFNISQIHVSQIVTRKRWAHI